MELGELLPKLPGPAGYPSSPPCPSSQDLPVPAALPSLKYLPAPEELPPAAPDLPARTPDVEEAIPCTSPLLLPEHSPSARSPLQSGPYSCQDVYYRVDRCESLLETSSCRPTVARARRDAIKTVYSLLKEPELRKKCKEVGLGHKGDKHALVKRLNKLKLLYNLKGEGRGRGPTWCW